MLVVDVLVALAVLGLVVTGVGVVRGIRQRSAKGQLAAARRTGSENAERLLLEGELKCAECDGKVDPSVDVFHKSMWWHAKCWSKTIYGL